MTAGKTLVAFLTAGYPTRRRCPEYLEALADGGADLIELGMPFSDPLADGPVIQAASEKALAGGATLLGALATLERFRRVPAFLMSYLNPLLALGLEKFFALARKAGVAGVIPVDLIPEEADEFLRAASGMPVTFLASPTSSPGRLIVLARKVTGFIYLVSVKGVTGARRSLDPELPGLVARVKRASTRPVYVGFGISTPSQAAEVSRLADGVVVGSAILQKIESGARPRDVARYIASLRRSMDAAPLRANSRSS